MCSGFADLKLEFNPNQNPGLFQRLIDLCMSLWGMLFPFLFGIRTAPDELIADGARSIATKEEIYKQVLSQSFPVCALRESTPQQPNFCAPSVRLHCRIHHRVPCVSPL